jgi:ABC-type nitrate/sulfonate/bicarbonate transport system ATPase subunit
MSKRPGTVKEVIEISFKRPREMEIKETVEFNRYAGLARRLMHSSR